MCGTALPVKYRHWLPSAREATVAIVILFRDEHGHTQSAEP
jgi:hypothetical protein